MYHVPIATPNADSVPTEYDIDQDDHDEITGRRQVTDYWGLIGRRYAREGMSVVKVDSL